MLPHLASFLVSMTQNVGLISCAGPTADRILGEPYPLGPDGPHKIVSDFTRILLILSSFITIIAEVYPRTRRGA